MIKGISIIRDSQTAVFTGSKTASFYGKKILPACSKERQGDTLGWIGREKEEFGPKWK